MNPPRKLRILFVCLGNSCRSPMAEAIARQHAPDLWEVSSGGLTPLGYVATPTTETIEKNGYSAEGLSSKPIMHSHWEAVDLVINMSGFEKHRVFEDPDKVEDWDVQDPFGAEPAVYQNTFDDIRTRIEDLAARLRANNGAKLPVH
ncbi:MAG TPA: low molecular weight phosphatase family protein [Candidatus Acidoferrum sp.]|nr:low molecular weight phosphatase family protein [Candidatus Acidoferrum sp.]